ncbi:aminomethyl transferase family protein, partial [Halorubrum sp. SS7]
AEAVAGIDADANPKGIDDALPASGAAVFDGDEAIGEITRTAVGPATDVPIALALVAFDADLGRVTVRVD